MCGRRVGDDGAQLALMDAMVFFAVAMVTSSIVFSYAHGRPMDAATECGTATKDLLGAFLRASVGFEVELGDGLEVSADENVADCLLAESVSVAAGVKPCTFDGLNQVLLASMERMTPTGFEPHLTVAGGDGEVTIRLERTFVAEGDAFAASQELPGPDGSVCRVVLVLVPSLGLQKVDV